MLLKLILIENLVRKVRLHQNIYIEINVTQRGAFECRRDIDVTVEQSRRSVLVKKPKDVVPAIEPIIFNRPGPALNLSEQLMLHVVLEFRVEDEQRVFLLRQRSLPAAILGAVVFKNANGDLASLVCQSLHSPGEALSVGLLTRPINHPLPQVVPTLYHSLVPEKHLLHSTHDLSPLGPPTP